MHWTIIACSSVFILQCGFFKVTSLKILYYHSYLNTHIIINAASVKLMSTSNSKWWPLFQLWFVFSNSDKIIQSKPEASFILTNRLQLVSWINGVDCRKAVLDLRPKCSWHWFGSQTVFPYQGFPWKALLRLDASLTHQDVSQLITGTTDGTIHWMCLFAKEGYN